MLTKTLDISNDLMLVEEGEVDDGLESGTSVYMVSSGDTESEIGKYHHALTCSPFVIFTTAPHGSI